MDANFETCGYCKMTWDSTFGAENCPMCELVDKIDQHIESILLQILTSHYSKYIFEIDDKTAAWNRENGFSFRINRKHNLMYLRLLENINLKNTYLLMASHIESAFNDIEQIYRLTYGKNPKGVNSKKKLYEDFIEQVNKKNLDESVFKNRNQILIVNFVRLVANVIKHKNSKIKNSSELGKVLKIKNDINLEDLWSIKIPGVRSNLYFGSTCEIAHSVRNFLLGVSLKIMACGSVKNKKITILNTLSLLKVKLRENISNQILKDVHGEGIMIFFSSFFKKANDSKQFSFLKERIIFLEKLLKINPKYVLALEIGIGFLPYDNKYISTTVAKMNSLTLNMHGDHVKTKINRRQFRKLYIKILDRLFLKYGRGVVSDLVWNEFDRINKKILPLLIIDFYKEIYALGKNDAGTLARGIGGAPFKKWNPFNFNS